jgi:hypothetical protein
LPTDTVDPAVTVRSVKFVPPARTVRTAKDSDAAGPGGIIEVVKLTEPAKALKLVRLMADLAEEP